MKARCLALRLALAAALAGGVRAAPADAPPNVVLIYCDDLGYADLGCYGAPRIRTPNLDRLAAEGIRLTRFYTAQPVCSAARAALLTGCYPSRVGIQGALGPQAAIGIAAGETTLAELLRSRGYATAIFGKWHLGHHPQFLPTRHGFDEYFGLPYSNDMWPLHPDYLGKQHVPERKRGYPDLPLLEQERIALLPVTSVEQRQLTGWYTDRAVDFIRRSAARPFFLYVPHTMPHVPLFASQRFEGRSRQGLYGDVIEEIDDSVGAILAELAKQGLEDRTLVLFSSDNGPWLSYGDHAGSAGPLREGKGTCWEGGVRVPCIARWPGRIPPGATCAEPAMTIDLLPTLAGLVRAELPAHAIDGRDIWPLLSGAEGASSPHEALYLYYRDNELQALISGRWKLLLPHTYRTLGGKPGGAGGIPVEYQDVVLSAPELYDLDIDEGETRNVATLHPDVVERLTALAEAARVELGDSLTGRVGRGVRSPGRVTDVP